MNQHKNLHPIWHILVIVALFFSVSIASHTVFANTTWTGGNGTFTTDDGCWSNGTPSITNPGFITDATVSTSSANPFFADFSDGVTFDLTLGANAKLTFNSRVTQLATSTENQTAYFNLKLTDNAEFSTKNGFYTGWNEKSVKPITGKDYVSYYTFSDNSIFAVVGEFQPSRKGSAYITIEDNAMVSATSFVNQNGSIFNMSGGKLNITTNLVAYDPITQTNGDVTVGNNMDNRSTYTLKNGTLTVNEIQLYQGNGGTIKQSGGTLICNTLDSFYNREKGSYNFTGGTFSVKTFDGSFTQNGGIFDPVTGTTISKYNVNEGTIQIEISKNADGNLVYDTLFVEETIAFTDKSSIDLLFDASQFSTGDEFTFLTAGNMTYQNGTDATPETLTTDHIAAMMSAYDSTFWIPTLTDSTLSFSINPNAVPEPATWTLLALAMLGIGYLRKH